MILYGPPRTGKTYQSAIYAVGICDGKSLDELTDYAYVFIIDEINRGNISKIFGELITLIEDAKRDAKREGKKEAASAILPYSHKSFSFPNHVYILGTMNKAHRSITLMDTALRRKFQFIEMMPDADVLRGNGADTVTEGDVNVDIAKMLEIMNKRIEYLFDREHSIGHAFMHILRNIIHRISGAVSADGGTEGAE